MTAVYTYSVNCSHYTYSQAQEVLSRSFINVAFHPCRTAPPCPPTPALALTLRQLRALVCGLCYLRTAAGVTDRPIQRTQHLLHAR